MAAGRTGSLESLRQLNRLRVVDALRDEGLISRAEIARRTGLSRSTVSSLVADLQADGLVVERSEPDAPPRRPGRPPADPARRFDRLRRRRWSASTSTTTTSAWRSRTSRDGARRARAWSSTSTTTPTTGSTPPPSWSRELLAEAGVEPARRARRRHGPPRPDRPRPASCGSTAILPGWVGLAAAERDAPAARPARPPRQRREPRRARRGRPSAPGAAPQTLVYVHDLLRHRRRPDHRRPPVPRRRRHRRRDRPRARRRRRPDLPLRQPRLPGDARRRPGARRAAAPQPRRRPDRPRRSCAGARGRRSGCRRAIADAGARRRPRGRRRSATCSTPTWSSSAATWREAGDLLLDPVREASTATRSPRPPRTPASWPARWASAPRCSARSPWPSRGRARLAARRPMAATR